jgi:hypothetical protein
MREQEDTLSLDMRGEAGYQGITTHGRGLGQVGASVDVLVRDAQFLETRLRYQNLGFSSRMPCRFIGSG